MPMYIKKYVLKDLAVVCNVCKGPEGMNFRLVKQVLSFEELNRPSVDHLNEAEKKEFHDRFRFNRSLPHPFPQVPRVIDLAMTIHAYGLIGVNAKEKPAWWFGAPNANDLASAVALNPIFFQNHPAALDPAATPVVLHEDPTINLSELVSRRSSEIRRFRESSTNLIVRLGGPIRALRFLTNPKNFEEDMNVEESEDLDEDSGSDCQFRLLFSQDEESEDSDKESEDSVLVLAPPPRVPRVVDLAATIRMYRSDGVDADSKPAWWFAAPDAPDLSTAVVENPNFFLAHPAALDPTAGPEALLDDPTNPWIPVSRRRTPRIRPSSQDTTTFCPSVEDTMVLPHDSHADEECEDSDEDFGSERQFRLLFNEDEESGDSDEESEDSDDESGSECQLRLLFTQDETTGDSDEKSGRE